MKTKKLYVILFSLVAVLIATTVFTQNKTEENKTIKFSHALHSEMADCASCHEAAETASELSRELLPIKDNCAMCHDVEDDENCNMCHYEDTYEPLEYEKGDISFNHEFHLSNSEMDCNTCHADEVDEEFAVMNPPMESCATCHNNETASMVCESCHNSNENLIPETHEFADFEDHHNEYIGEDNCAMCHTEDFCETCHTATRGGHLDAFTQNLNTIYAPHKYINNTKEQVLSRVHDLDYRFTHGLDARGKISECQTCHETETFCAECHSQNGGLEGSALLPISHLSQNFKTIGVGSGGGEHADLARRDIESCQSCHDVQGGDPSCIMCHSDNDGIKETNPKTHEIGFMKDVNGDWHSDDGSVCYNCHTSTNASTGVAPIGFCGYCHDKK